jgi:hypothetical protein
MTSCSMNWRRAIPSIPCMCGTGQLSGGDVVLFFGRDFLLTVHRTPVPLLEPLRPDKVLYCLVATFVESYLPLVDQLGRGIERLEDEVLGALGPPRWRKLVRSVARCWNCGVS